MSIARGRGVLLLAAAWLSLPSTARAIVTFDAGQLRASMPIGLLIEILQDPSAALTFDDVNGGAAAAQFRPCTAMIPHFGITYSAVWVRFTLRNGGDRPQSLLLVNNVPMLERVDFYASEDGERFARLAAGLAVPPAQRPYRDRVQVFPATIEPNRPLIVYMRFVGRGLMAIDLSLWDEPAFLRHNGFVQLLVGVYFGFLLILIIINLLLSSAFRDRGYLFYALFLTVFAAYLASWSGYAALYLWPGHPYWALHATVFFCGLAIFCGMLFTRLFLGGALRMPRFAPVFQAIMALAIVAALAGFADPRAAAVLIAVASLTSYAAIITASAVGWARGERAAGYLLLAWSLFAVGSAVFAMAAFGAIEPNELTMDAMPLGFAIAALILCFALSDRITSIHERHRLEMNQTVAARTADLKQTVETLDREIAGHERTVRALRTSEAKYRELVESVNDMIYQTDERGFFTYLNPVAVRIFEAGPENLLGTHFTEWIRSDYRERVREFYIQQRDESTANTYLEFPFVSANGKESWVGQSVHLVLEHGKVAGFRGVARDNTERRRAETALAESERRLAEIIDFLPDATLVIDAAGKVIAWNRAIEALTGVPAAEMLGRGDYEYALPFYGEKRPILIDLALKRNPEFERRYADISVLGDAVAGEAYMPQLRSGAVYLYGAASVLRDSQGRVAGAIESIRDITERKHAEERLRESEQRYRLLADNLQDVIWTMDLNLRFLYTSPSVRQMRGFTVEEALTHTMEQNVAPGSLPVVVQALAEELARDGQPGVDPYRSRRLELEQLRKDGSTFWAESIISFLRDDQLRPVGFLGTTRDITSRRRMEAEILAAKDAAEAANRAKSGFLANMSHELRTPLNAIIGFSDLLRQQLFGGLNAKQVKYVDAIFVSGRHLLQLINDILDLSKVEAGKMEVELNEVEIVPLIESSWTMVKEKARDHAIALEWDVPDSLRGLRLEIDERKMKQIMFNLLSNAVKFTPDRGRVSVSAQCRDGQLSVSVRDTGIGVAPADQSRIFREFERLENPYTRNREGAGLGLALTARLVAMHGGQIGVESEGEGKGSTFWFTIPLRQAKPIQTPPAGADESAEARETPIAFLETPAGPNDPPRLSCLVIDDDAREAVILSDLLRSRRCAVARAFTGEDGLRQAVAAPPDLIVLDVSMPGMTGIEVVRQLREHPATRDVSIVIYTSIDLTVGQRSALAAQVQRIAAKPGKEILLEELARLEALRAKTK